MLANFCSTWVAGPDGIPPELLKCALGPFSRALHTLFIQVWRSGRVPSEWRDGVIISLYKGNGPKTKCSSYRPITLLSVPGKVFAHVLLSRIQPLFESARRPQQSGFTAGGSTVDAILALSCIGSLIAHSTWPTLTSKRHSTPSTALHSGRHYAVRASQTY